MWSILSGIVGLSLLELLVTNRGAADRVTGIAGLPAAVARYFIDPTVPGISPKASTGAKGSSSSTQGAGGAWVPNPKPTTKPGKQLTTASGATVHSSATNKRGPVGPGI